MDQNNEYCQPKAKINAAAPSFELEAFDGKDFKTVKLEDYKEGDKKVPFKVIKEYTGKDLEGVYYEQLIDWVKLIITVNLKNLVLRFCLPQLTLISVTKHGMILLRLSKKSISRCLLTQPVH